MSISSNKISILGCGWLGLALGETLVKEGYKVRGSTRAAAKIPLLEEKNIQPYLLNIGAQLEGTQIDEFFQSDILLLNIPPGRRQPDVAAAYPAGIQLVINAALAGTIKKILFVSSTSVYASQRQLAVESDLPHPTTASGKALVLAEHIVANTTGLESTILRLAGLVGGERRPGRWFAGKKALPGGLAPVNLVHRDDCIKAIQLILEKEKWNEVYNLCADEHPCKADYYPFMATEAGLEQPEFLSNDEVPYKLISNEKIKKDLNWFLKYPNPYLF